MNYVSYRQLDQDLRDFAAKLPEFDMIAGVPRSGLMVASRLALLKNCALGVVEGLAGTILRLQGGPRDLTTDVQRILVVDDSANTGKAMNDVRKSLYLMKGVEYAALYVVPGVAERLLDHAGRFIENPRTFAWNLFNPTVLADAAVDIDGVLCNDPTPADGNDEAFAAFIANAKPRFITPYRIHSLVTCRLERDRPATEDWLKRHGVVYDHLEMMQFASKAERERANIYAEYKARKFIGSGCSLFIESNLSVAKKIAERTKKPVICTEDFELHLCA